MHVILGWKKNSMKISIMQFLGSQMLLFLLCSNVTLTLLHKRKSVNTIGHHFFSCVAMWHSQIGRILITHETLLLSSPVPPQKFRWKHRGQGIVEFVCRERNSFFFLQTGGCLATIILHTGKTLDPTFPSSLIKIRTYIPN